MTRTMILSLLRWVSIPLAIAVLASTVKSFIAGPYWILAMLLGLLSLVVWTVALLAPAIRAMIRRNWKKAALFPGAFLLSLPLVFLGILSGDYIHLAVMYPYYAVKIRSAPDWQSKEVQFYWGDDAVSVLDGVQMRVLIYDASGKIAVGDRPDRSNGGIKSNIQHLIGNFYLEHQYSG